MSDNPQRPVYRHVIVKRRQSFSPKDRDRVERLRAWMDQDPKTRGPLDEDLVALYQGDSLRNTRRLQLGAEYEDKPEVTGNQEAVVVSGLVRCQVPGGTERLPTHASVLRRVAAFDEAEPQAAFMKAAEELQREFERKSDNHFLMLDEQFRANCTVVTVAYTPLSAYPLADRGFAVGAEYYQVVRFGDVDVSEFEVYSDTGVFPISPPNEMTLASMMKPASEWVCPPPSWPEDHPIAIAKRELAAKKVARSQFNG